jgi:magnesium-dependent phosphatase 1
MASSHSLPKLIAFDLDGTLWSPDMYQLWGGGSPFQVVDDGTKYLRDRVGAKVRLLGISGRLLHDLKYDPMWESTICALASTTDEPDWAQECLEKFRTTPGNEPLAACVDSPHIYKANKQTHFRNMKSHYPEIEFSEMLFFDNEMGNINSVKKLGVHCVYCPDGMTEEVWVNGLEQYRRARSSVGES